MKLYCIVSTSSVFLAFLKASCPKSQGGNARLRFDASYAVGKHLLFVQYVEDCLFRCLIGIEGGRRRVGLLDEGGGIAMASPNYVGRGVVIVVNRGDIVYQQHVYWRPWGERETNELFVCQIELCKEYGPSYNEKTLRRHGGRWVLYLQLFVFHIAGDCLFVAGRIRTSYGSMPHPFVPFL